MTFISADATTLPCRASKFDFLTKRNLRHFLQHTMPEVLLYNPDNSAGCISDPLQVRMYQWKRYFPPPGKAKSFDAIDRGSNCIRGLPHS